MYTNVVQKGNSLLVRGIENGHRYKHKVDFHPTLWVQGNLRDATDKWHTIDGQVVYSIKPGTMWDCKKFSDQYKDVHGMAIFESPGHPYQYIAETHPGEIRFDPTEIKVAIVDIETETEYGFPEPALSAEKIQLITVEVVGVEQIITWGTKPFTDIIENVEYRCFDSEETMLRDFMVWWQQNYPDVVTGWNSSLFDITYMYNRMCKVVGETIANKLSPWGNVSQREIDMKGRVQTRTYIDGVAQLDYLELYKKFGTYSVKESYKLEAIAQEELGEGKLENPYSTFKEFYTKDWNLFVKYNVRDVRLVLKLDDKMKLMDLALTIAYAAKVNYEDVFGPVKLWDVIIYNYLNDQKIVVPRRRNSQKVEYEGGYVKEVLAGKHKWCVSFDLNSLYPHLIMQYNMSLETIADKRFDVSVERLLAKEVDLHLLPLLDVAMAANGCCFTREKVGLLPTQMQRYYDLRVTYKKQMIKVKQEFQTTGNAELTKEISRLNNLQMAMKILLNSAYGACANPYFRYFDIRIAEGITLSGQLAIRWVANRLNDLLNTTMGTEGVDRVVMVDTDSVVLTLEDLVARVCAGKTTEECIQFMDRASEDILQPYIDKVYQELAEYTNAHSQRMQMKRENLIEVMLMVSKKRYAMSVHNSEGVQYKEPQLKIMGLQMVKSSTPAVVRKKLKGALQPIMHGTEKDTQEYVACYREEFDKFSPEEIAFPKSISDLGKYASKTSIYLKGTPIHVRGALLYNHHLKRLGLTLNYPAIQNGDKLRFLYLKKPNPIHEDTIAFIDKLPVEFGLHEFVDYSKMFDKTFQAAVQNIIESLGWSAETQSTLEDWFA